LAKGRLLGLNVKYSPTSSRKDISNAEENLKIESSADELAEYLQFKAKVKTASE